MEGRFIAEIWDHPRLMRARESGDPGELQAALDALRGEDGKIRRWGYECIDHQEFHNQRTVEGEKYQIDLLTGLVSNTGIHWYLAPFSSNSTPTKLWDGDSFATSGGDATEFIGYDETTRQECVFVAATGDSSIVSAINTTQAILTISTGVTATIYGLGLTTSNVRQYAGGAAKLYAAERYAIPKEVLSGQILPLQYQVYAL
jgi:hypothetical protein